jgi:hypothetical protein
MIRTIAIMMIICGSTFFLQAETVSLSGTVKKTGGTVGIAGVKVNLAKFTNLSATTDANGAFNINGVTTSIKLPAGQVSLPRFVVHGNSITFSPVSRNMDGSLEIFSSDGKRKTSIRLKDVHSGQQTKTLSVFHSGINILRITIGPESFSQTIMCLGTELYLKKEIPSMQPNGNFTLAKQTTGPAVDTLVAEKEGYDAKKVGIDKYDKQGIIITLDSSVLVTGPCTRAALQAAVDKYIEAQKAGDPLKMPLASQVKYTQNIVKTALPTMASQRDIFDVDSCRTFTELVITAGSHPYVIGTRLRLDNGKISEVNTMVTDDNDWSFSATKYLSNSKNENWDTLPVNQRCSRQALLNAGNAYFDLIFDWTKDTVPWDDQCYRIEGGNMVADPCTKGTTGNSVKTTCRTYVVDVDKGSVNLFCYFGYGPDSHLFRLESGKVRYIHTLTACGDTVAAGKDCWGIAAKGKGKAHCTW